MRLRQAMTALGIGMLATLAYAWQRTATSNAVAKHLAGTWAVDREITARLDPDSRLAQFNTMTFTDDSSVMKRLGDISARLKNMNLITSGTLTLEGTNFPYVLAEKEGMTTLIWFHQGEETKVGDPVARIASVIVAKVPTNDLLFLGADEGARNASVCLKRAEAAK
jgi:hypothetical protein